MSTAVTMSADKPTTTTTTTITTANIASSLNGDGSNASLSPASSHDSGSKKRDPKVAGLDANGNPKPVKRRAAKACAACRARKVRCDVMQRYHVTPDGEVTCSNCTMDGIRCVIEESKRRKKHLNGAPTNPTPAPAPAPAPTNIANSTQAWGNGIVDPSEISNPDARRWSGSSHMSQDGEDFTSSSHVPHPIYQNVHNQLSRGESLRRQSYISAYDSDPTFSLLASASLSGDRTRTRLESPVVPPAPILKHKLPDYLKPLPQRMTSVDIDYLFAKGALSLPEISVRNALLRSYLEYVHPYMPLVEVHELLQIIDEGNGDSGRISLLLFQAIMFAGTAFVDIEFLRAAGYTSRKSARKAFFQKARVLYDFDYEIDRVSLVQALLLMTYWYETPDDQKDTWHWMGVAISLAHTIGLHRNPENSNMEPNRKKLWKRIWWSCFMRDRLVALGMRRPTRVKDEDYDVPMLTEDDFEIQAVDPNNSIIAGEVGLIISNEEAQRKLAQMCVAKAKLCLCISHVLSAQYSVLVRNQGMQGQEGNTTSSVMLFPKKLDQTDEVKRCDIELNQWVADLPESCRYSIDVPSESNDRSLYLQRSLLHMVYFTTLSALHRPQVLPAAPVPQPESSRSLQDLSRKKVREASREITRISSSLHSLGLEKYLPTTGVTVLLPAIIIHLLDIKSCNDKDRQTAMEGFCQCMLVLERLRDNYASADFATQFLDAAIRKADIDVVIGSNSASRGLVSLRQEDVTANLNSYKVRELRERSNKMAAMRHTPPPQEDSKHMMDIRIPSDEIQSALTPPDSDVHSLSHHPHPQNGYPAFNLHGDWNGMGFAGGAGDAVDLNDFLNFDTGNEMWNVPLEEGAHGESGGFIGDMGWVDQPMGWSRMNSPGLEGNEWVDVVA